MTKPAGSSPKFDLYGIKNCDTVRKAQKYLAEQSLVVNFHDFRLEDLTTSTLSYWLKLCGLSAILNTRSTTWRQLGDEDKNLASSPESACDLLLRHPTLIKRPVLCAENGAVLIGFSPESYDNFIRENR